MAFFAPSVGSTVEVSELESLALGALIAGDGSGAPATLTVGSNGAVLQALSTEATGLIWRTAPSLVDSISWSAGTAVTGTLYSIQRDADGTNQLHLNVPTGASFEFSVNDGVEFTLSATAANFQNNSISTTGGGSLTGTWSDLGTVTTVDINGGTLDGVVIGGASAAAATVTTLSLNNAISWSAGAAVTAGSYQVSRDADATNQLHLNVPTGASFEFSINDAAELVLNATNLQPGANDGLALGVSGTAFADLFLASGAVINFAAGDVTITHSDNALLFAGASNGYPFDAAVLPNIDDAAALGSTTFKWSDLFLASGAVINFNSGDVTLTHAANLLTMAGGDFTLTDALVSLNRSSTGAALVITDSATTYTTGVAALAVRRTGNLTGVAGETIFDVSFTPNFTLTEPSSSTINYILQNIDLTDLQITAAAGDAITAALRLFACNDSDALTNLALLVDEGKVRLDGGGKNFQQTTVGGVLEIQASTVGGNNPSSTIAVGSAVSLGVTTFTNGTATLTMTDATSLYIAGIPVASTNVAFTNTATALWVDAGNVRFDGNILLPTSGSVINFASGDVTLTHGSNLLTLAGGDLTLTDSKLTLNQSTTSQQLVISHTATTYVDGQAFVEASRTGALTGVAAQVISDVLIAPDFTLTEPSSGTVRYNALELDVTTVAVTAAAGSSIVCGLLIRGNADADAGSSLALDITAGAANFDGRVIMSQGADIASASSITLGGDGNVFEITGTTTINLISNVNWNEGAVVTLVFNESLTVNHATATSGTNITILLAGSANFSATANDTLTLALCSTTANGQAWREVSRTAI